MTSGNFHYFSSCLVRQRIQFLRQFTAALQISTDFLHEGDLEVGGRHSETWARTCASDTDIGCLFGGALHIRSRAGSRVHRDTAPQ